MKGVEALLFLGMMGLSPAAMSQSVFTGTWRPDPQIFSPTRKPDVIELANHIYECRSCSPPYKIEVDGHDHNVAGNPFYDTLRMTVLDDRTISKVAKKAGKVVLEAKVAVSADSATMTEVQTIYEMAPRPIEFTTHSKRVSAGPQGSHAVSGEWRATDGDLTNHAEDTVFQVSENTLSMSDRMGRSFSAKLDGTDAPYSGSEEFTSVSLKMIDKNTMEESDKKDGKIVKISLWSIGPDGKTMHVRFDDTHGHVQEQDGHKVE
jgi:hypothetical protein